MMRGNSTYDAVKEIKPVVVMILVQICYAGMNILFKLAAEDGMNLRILIAYRHIFATATMLPLALIFEKEKMPKLTCKYLLLLFLSGLIGSSLSSNLFIEGLALTSASFAAAASSLVPGFAFITAVLFRVENLRLETKAGMAKLVGTVLGVGGALIFTLYKGVKINIWSTHIDLLHHNGGHVATSRGSPILGMLMVIASYILYTLWLILQGKISKQYKAHYWNMAFMCKMGMIQSVGFAVCTERHWTKWRLGWDIRLLASAYTGIVVTGISYALTTWCVHIRGPLFVSMFSPLMLLIVALVGSLALDEQLHLGSMIGAILIIGGLYMVLWGKAEEMKKTTRIDLELIEQPRVSVNNKEQN